MHGACRDGESCLERQLIADATLDLTVFFPRSLSAHFSCSVCMKSVKSLLANGSNPTDFLDEAFGCR